MATSDESLPEFTREHTVNRPGMLMMRYEDESDEPYYIRASIADLHAVLDALPPEQRADVCGHRDCEDVQDNLLKRAEAAESRVAELERERDSARASLAAAERVVEAAVGLDELMREHGVQLLSAAEPGALATALHHLRRTLDALPTLPDQPAAPRIVDTGPRAPTIRSTTPRQPSVPGDVVANATGAEKDPRYRTLEHRLLDKTTAAWVLLQVAAAWEESGVEPFGQELRERSVRIARESGSMPEQPAAPEPQPDPATIDREISRRVNESTGPTRRMVPADEPHGPTLAAAYEGMAEDMHATGCNVGGPTQFLAWGVANRLRERAAKVRGGVEGGEDA